MIDVDLKRGINEWGVTDYKIWLKNSFVLGSLAS
jgi:hypothetical protein